MKKEYQSQKAKEYNEKSDTELIDVISEEPNTAKQGTVKALLDKRLKRSIQYLTEVIEKNGKDANAYNEETKRYNKRTIWLTIITIVLSFVMLSVAGLTLIKTQEALDVAQKNIILSSDPSISIEPIKMNNNSGIIEEGNILANDSKVDFVLKNNFLGKLSDVNIEMGILRMHKDEQSQHSAICPIGIVGYNATNSNFVVTSHIKTTNIIPKTISLDGLGEYDFMIDYKKLNNSIKLSTSTKEKYFIKIDISYKKEYSNKIYNYSKIYRIINWYSSKDNHKIPKEFLVDVDEDPTSYGFIDSNNEVKQLTGLQEPFLMYPFKNEEFLIKIKYNIKQPYTWSSADCFVFKMDKNIYEIK